jgi:hypothetical protein
MSVFLSMAKAASAGGQERELEEAAVEGLGVALGHLHDGATRRRTSCSSSIWMRTVAEPRAIVVKPSSFSSRG